MSLVAFYGNHRAKKKKSIVFSSCVLKKFYGGSLHQEGSGFLADEGSVDEVGFTGMISDEPYRTSTQYRLFSYSSPDELLAQRTKTNTHSRSQLPPEASYLTVSEEIELVDYYVSKLWGFCRLFKVPSHVKVLHSMESIIDINFRQPQQVFFFGIIFMKRH